MRKCFVPGCKTGYASDLKNCKELGVRSKSIFRVPKKPDLIKKWASAIPRKYRLLSTDDFVCEAHFHASDVIHYHEMGMPDGTVYETKLRGQRLKDNAVPCIFPNLPAYLTSNKRKRKPPKERKTPVKKCKVENIETEEGRTIPLTDSSLVVDISDALSEKDKVKFTVHTRTTMKTFQKSEFLVVRQHEEFIWLHDRYEEEPKYAGYIIPPPPPRPNFDASREKLQRLGEGEGTMTKEEFTKMKQELEAEYLATFKKTVAMHEVFLTRLACHSIFREDSHLHVFLEYDQDLCARPKGKFQQMGGLFKSIGSTTDQYYLNATVRDVNDFFEQQMSSLTEYHAQLKEATTKADRMTEKHKELADSYIKISSGLLQLANSDNGHLDKFCARVSDFFEKSRKVESRVASDQDLKLADTLRYYMRDSQAAKSLLVRRLKCLANYENANRTLEKARHKNKDIHAAEAAQSAACEQFEAISAQAKEELLDFKTRRLHAFRKSLIELAELEIKHARTQQDLLRKSIQNLKELL